MPRVLILYWSLTGTTSQVARSISDGLLSEGAECTLRDLREGLPEDITPFDIVGVGSPIHWFRLPIPVRKAITRLGPLGGRSVFVFSLYGTCRGGGLNQARHALLRAGGRELGVFSCLGEDRFYPYARLGALFSPGHPTAAELEAASAFGRSIATAHGSVEHGGPDPAPAPFDPPTHTVHALERLVTGPRLTRVVYSRAFKVDSDRCSRCGRCARGCPVGNIEWRRGELPSWRQECVLCLLCVTNCAEEAVTCPMDWSVFRPFVRWNIRRALRDPEIEHAGVRFERGKFIRT